MKRMYAAMIVMALCAGLLALNFVSSRDIAGLVPTARAQEAATVSDAQRLAVAPFPRNRECTNGSVMGKFGVTIQGSLLPPLTPVPVPGASVGSFELDAAGNLNGADTLSLGGQIIPRTYTGAVSIKSNCTFSARITAPGQTVNLSGVIVDGGDEIQFIQTDPGTIFTGVAKRL